MLRDTDTTAGRQDTTSDWMSIRPDYVEWPSWAPASSMRQYVDRVATTKGADPELLHGYREALREARNPDELVAAAAIYADVFPAGEELLATAQTIAQRERDLKSGAYRGPAQVLVPGAGDVATPEGKSRLAAIVVGGIVLVGAGAYLYQRVARFLLGGS